MLDRLDNKKHLELILSTYGSTGDNNIKNTLSWYLLGTYLDDNCEIEGTDALYDTYVLKSKKGEYFPRIVTYIDDQLRK